MYNHGYAERRHRNEATPVTGWAETGNDKFAGGSVANDTRVTKTASGYALGGYGDGVERNEPTASVRSRVKSPARLLSDALRIVLVAGAMAYLWWQMILNWEVW